MALNRLEEEELNAGRKGARHHRPIFFSGNHHDDRGRVHGGGTDLPCELDPVRGWHVHIQKDGMKFLTPQTCNGFHAVGCRVRVHTRRAEDLRDESASWRMVVYDQDPRGQPVAPPGMRDSCRIECNGNKPTSGLATFSDFAASGSTRLEADKRRLAST